MILLSDKAVMQKDGGQALVGGLDVEVCRNFFGSQVRSSTYQCGSWELGGIVLDGSTGGWVGGSFEYQTITIQCDPSHLHLQIDSFEVALQLEGAAKDGLGGAAADTAAGAGAGGGKPVTAVFIRAPAILEVIQS